LCFCFVSWSLITKIQWLEKSWPIWCTWNFRDCILIWWVSWPSCDNAYLLIKVSLPSQNMWYFGCYILNDCTECTSTSICLVYQIKNTTSFSLGDHLHVYTCKITNISYYFQHKMPSKLRCIQFFNAGFREEIIKVHIPRI
jgi:hypothetical protein